MEKKVTRGRKPKVQVEQSIVNEEIVNEIVEQAVEEVVVPQPEAPQTPKQGVEEKPAYMYKCMECGQVNLVKRCKRCSSGLVRPI
jgi:translation initiation factor 2 beta subunit (eIF-2beta)/eIF-5